MTTKDGRAEAGDDTESPDQPLEPLVWRATSPDGSGPSAATDAIVWSSRQVTDEVADPSSAGSMVWRGSPVEEGLPGAPTGRPVVWRGTPVGPEHTSTAFTEPLVWRGSPVAGSDAGDVRGTPRTWQGSLVADRIWIDEDGLLHRGERWVALSELEWRIIGPLVDRLGEMVSRVELATAGWGEGTDSGPKLTRRVTRTRKRLLPLDLRIVSVSGRGYVLKPD